MTNGWVSKFKIGDRVFGDDEGLLKLTVVGVLFDRGTEPQYKLAYWFNGERKELWMHESLLLPT